MERRVNDVSRDGKQSETEHMGNQDRVIKGKRKVSYSICMMCPPCGFPLQHMPHIVSNITVQCFDILEW